jgi:cobalamin biosynthesis Co2+ chelatase CbiK
MLFSSYEFHKISDGKAILFLRTQIKSHLRVYRDTLHFESKERVGKDILLRHGVRHFAILLLIMQDIMIQTHQIKLIRINKKCTHSKINRILHEKLIKRNFKFPPRK